MMFGPRNKKEELIIAEERYRVDLQYRIQRRMNECGINSKQLAKMLNMSKSKLYKKIFDHDAKLPARLVAKVFHVMGAQLITIYSASMEYNEEANVKV